MSPSLRDDLNDLWTVSKGLQEYLESGDEPQLLKRPPRMPGPIVGAGCNTARGGCTPRGQDSPATIEDLLIIVRWMNERFGGLMSAHDI